VTHTIQRDTTCWAWKSWLSALAYSLHNVDKQPPKACQHLN